MPCRGEGGVRRGDINEIMCWRAVREARKGTREKEVDCWRVLHGEQHGGWQAVPLTCYDREAGLKGDVGQQVDEQQHNDNTLHVTVANSIAGSIADVNPIIRQEG
jgi:hypothetical protein